MTRLSKYYFLFFCIAVSCNSVKLKDITAENYRELGLNSNQTIESNSGLSIFCRAHFFGKPIKFSDPELTYYNFNVSEIGNGFVEYYDASAGITYSFMYTKNELESVLLIAGPKQRQMSLEYNIQNGDDMINELIRKEQYLYHRTKLIDGDDIVIKEFPKYFLIGEINRDDKGQIGSILFRCWNKKKNK